MSILSLCPPSSHQELLPGPQKSNIVPFPTGLQQHPALSEAPAARRSSVQAWKTKARSDFLKMAIPGVRTARLEQSSARNSPLREAPAWKKNNNNNSFLLSLGKNQESFQGLGVSSCLGEASQSWTFAKTSDLKSNSLQHFIAASAGRSLGPGTDTK